MVLTPRNNIYMRAFDNKNSLFDLESNEELLGRASTYLKCNHPYLFHVQWHTMFCFSNLCYKTLMKLSMVIITLKSVKLYIIYNKKSFEMHI